MAQMKKNEENFPGKIGQNVHKSRTEIEENIVRLLYDWWSEGRTLTRAALCEKLGITRRKLAYYITSMTEHGYLEETQEKEILSLTDFGKEQGEDCHYRHQSITHFIQVTCGLDEVKAEENACRMEHVLSDDVIRGMSQFLRTGEVYDSVVRNVDFHTRYEVGEYEFRMSLYQMDKRYPRILAEEYKIFEERICLEVGEKESFVYVRQLPDTPKIFFWYKRGECWKKATRSERGFQIPGEIFVISSNGKIPVTEGEGMIAITKNEMLPKENACRELNIHLW